MPDKDDVREIELILNNKLLTVDAPIFYVLMMDIPCVLGDEEMAERVIQTANELRDTESGWPWTWHLLDYYAGDFEEDKLFELAGPFTHELCGVHYVIAMRLLLEGTDLDEAEYHFNKAIETHTVGHWAYHSAKVFVERLGDPAWRKWLQKRRSAATLTNAP